MASEQFGISSMTTTPNSPGIKLFPLSLNHYPLKVLSDQDSVFIQQTLLKQLSKKPAIIKNCEGKSANNMMQEAQEILHKIKS